MVLLKIYRSLQERHNFANRSRIDKIIVMVRVAHFFDSRCIKYKCGIKCARCYLFLSSITVRVTRHNV